MKKSNTIISDWLDKHGNPEIEKQVKRDIEKINQKELLYKLLQHLSDEDELTSCRTYDQIIDDFYKIV